MTETALLPLLSGILTMALLAGGLAALVRLVRRDSFAGPGTGFHASDELGPLAHRRRPA